MKRGFLKGFHNYTGCLIAYTVCITVLNFKCKSHHKEKILIELERDSTSWIQSCVQNSHKKLEEQFALQLEEQEAIYGPSAIPLCLPADLPDLTHHTTESTRSSLSSVSEG